jgi:hypothetical protein
VSLIEFQTKQNQLQKQWKQMSKRKHLISPMKTVGGKNGGGKRLTDPAASFIQFGTMRGHPRCTQGRGAKNRMAWEGCREGRIYMDRTWIKVKHTEPLKTAQFSLVGD